MTENKTPNRDLDLRNKWLKIHETNHFERNIENSNEDKLDTLKTIYRELYCELRDIHSRQQQIITWGLSFLSASGIITIFLANSMNTSGMLIILIILGIITITLSSSIGFLSEERMSISRQLDRFHQLFGVFEVGFFVKGNILFDPNWFGWGFEENRDANWRLTRMYQFVLWGIFIIDIIILLGKVGVISIFN